MRGDKIDNAVVPVAPPKIMADFKIPVNLVDRIRESSETVVGLKKVNCSTIFFENLMAMVIMILPNEKQRQL